MFKIHDEPESPIEGACCRYTYAEPESPNEGACCRDMMIPPNKGAGLMYMMNRNRPMRGRV